MTEQFDLYVAPALSATQVCDLVAQALAVDFELHDSYYLNGEYFLWQGDGYAQIKVIANAPDDEGYLLDPEIPSMQIMVHASCLSAEANAVLRHLGGLELLRSELV